MTRKTQRILQLASIVAFGLACDKVSGADGKWNIDAGGNWSDTSRWTNNQIADGVGSVANLAFNITANRTVTIDTTPRTVGRLRFNDDTTSSSEWTLAGSGGGNLTMAVSTGTPIIEAGNRTPVINAQIFGTQGILKTGGGVLCLNNVSNAYTGKTTATNGTLRINTDLSLGPVPESYVADQIMLTTGATLMNNTSEPVIPPNRGITLGSGGGALQAGWARTFTINSIIAGVGGLTIRSDATPGLITLNGANSYTGPTVVGTGTAGGGWAWLEVNGSTAVASTMTVRTNGSLGGIGTIHGPLVVTTNGIISPGPLTRPGTLTVNNSATLTNATLNYDLAGTDTPGGGINDLLVVNGALTLVGSITITINPLNGALLPGTYRLINCGSLDASLATITCDNPRYGATFDTSTAGQLNMVIANGNPGNLVWSGTGGTNWDANNTINWLSGTTPDKFYQGDAVTFNDSGLYTNAAGIFEVAPATTIGSLLPSSVTVDTTNNFTLTSSGQSGRLGGAMNLYKGGSGVLTLTTGNGNQPNIYVGTTVVTNGTLRLGNARALGLTNGGTIITNLGRLDMNGQSDVYEPITVQGAGPDGTGSIVNSGGGTANNGLRGQVTMAGDTTIGPTNRTDIYGGKLIGNGYKLTKKGTGETALSNLGDTGLGDVEIQQGILTLLGNVTAGLSNGSINIVSNAVLNYWNLNNPTNPIDKLVAMTNGIWRTGSGSNYHTGVVTLDGTNEFGGGGTSLTLNTGVTGPGALRKTGTNTLYLMGANNFSGSASIEAGTLALGSSATLSATPGIHLSASTSLFDVTANLAGFTLGSGQTLSGNGTINGLVTAVTGSTLAPGSSPGTLTFNHGLALNNASGIFELGASPAGANDQVQVAGSGLTASGVTTLKIVPLEALNTSTPYSLFRNFGTPLPSGSEANFAITSDSRYNFVVLPTDASFGSEIQVQVNGSGSAATLLWRGADATNPTWWDLKTTTNWLNAGAPDKFFLGDITVFDDSAVGTTAELIGTVQPSMILLSNASKSITISGAGSLLSGSLSAEGTGLTTIANTAGNSFVYGVTNNNGTLVFANSSPNTFGGSVQVNNGTLVFANSSPNTLGGPLQVNNGTVRIETPVNNAFSSIVLDGGTLAFTQTNPAAVAAPISGFAGQISKHGTNVLTLSGVNSSFHGPIQVSSGTLRAGSATSLGSTTSGTIIIPGATLDVNGQLLGFEPVQVAGSGVGGLGAIVNGGAESQNALRSVTLTGDTTFGAHVNRWDIRTDVGASPNATLLTSGNPFKLTKVGIRDVSIVGVNVDPALGDIDVMEGTLGWETVTTGVGDPARTLTIYSNASFRMYNNSNLLDKRFIVRDGGRFNAASGAANGIIGPVLMPNGIATFDVAASSSMAFLNEISGDGTLLKVNSGTLILSGTNVFTGPVTNSNGTLVLSNDLAVGQSKLITTRYGTATGGGGTRLALRGGLNTPVGVVGSFLATTNGGDFRVSIASESLTNTWNGPILVNGENIVGFYGAPANPLILKGEILGTNGYTGTTFFRGAANYCGTVDNLLNAPTATMAITDNSVWIYNHPSNLWARTSIAYGRLVLGTNNAACPTAPLSLGQNGSSTGTLDLNGFTQSVPSVTTINGNNHFIGSSSTTADSLFIFDGGTNVSVMDGRIVDSVASGTRKVAVTMKSGTLTLLGANSYTGDTVVAGGTLALGTNGTLASPRIDVQVGGILDVSSKLPSWSLLSGQILTGNGTVQGALTATFGSSVAPGASIGALTVSGAASLQPGSTNIFEVSKNAGTNDVLSAAAISYGGVLHIQNIGSDLAPGDVFKLFSAGSYSGAFNEIKPAPGTGLTWDTTQLTANGSIKVVQDIPTTPTNMTYTVTGSTLSLQWPASYLGWTAQSNSVNVADPGSWFNIPGSETTTTLNVPIDPGTPKVFYRLRYLTP